MLVACERRSTPQPRALEATTSAHAPVVSLEHVRPLANLPGDTAKLRSVAHVVVTGEGLIVADTAAMNVRRYTIDGRAAATMGSRGIGPGQFQSIMTLAGSADSIFTFDRQLMRVSGFDRNGTLLFTRRLEPRAESDSIVVRNGGGNTWLLLEPVTAAREGVRAVARLLRWAPGATAWAPVAELPFVPRATDSTMTMLPTWAVHRTGEFWLAHGPGYAITWYSARGDSLRSIVLDIDEKPRELRTAANGDLWVRIDPSPDVTEWHAFDAFGSLRFRVSIPRSLTVHSIVGDDALIASTIDATTGEPTLAHYRIVR